MAGWEDAPLVEEPKTPAWMQAPEVSATTAQPQAAPRWDVVGDIGRTFNSAIGAIKQDVQTAFPSNLIDQSVQNLQDKGTIGAMISGPIDAGKRLLSVAKVPLDAVSAAMSPITGAIHGTVGSALSYGFPHVPQDVANAYGLEADPKKAADRAIDSSMLGAAPENMGAIAAATSGAVPRVPVPPRPMAREAISAGYVLPPRLIRENAGPIADVASAGAGKVKLAQEASQRNQAVTNKLAAQSIGLPPDTMLTESAFENVRKNAGRAYDNLENSLPTVTTDQEFVNAINDLGGRTGKVAAEFPELVQNKEIENLVNSLANKNTFSMESAIGVVKRLREKAKTNFNAVDDTSKLELAFAQRNAADEIENLVERNLQAFGNPSLVSEFRNARQTIAKSYDLETATNTITGNVNPLRLSALSSRRPLTGELKTIADTASAFPQAMQPLDRFGGVEPMSVLDLAAAGASFAHGNVKLGTAIMARPFVRQAVLSNPIQSSVLNKTAPAPMQTPSLPPISASGAVPLSLLLGPQTNYLSQYRRQVDTGE